jgi:ribonuclease PH
MKRSNGRTHDALREVSFTTGIAPHAAGSVLVGFGDTRVICAACVEEVVPRWMKDQKVPGGWITAEYAMLPYSTLTRKPRDITRGKQDGRGTEIQRLIGRSLRAVVDLKRLGPRTVWIDCDVLQADGGTRTAAVTGACVALELACEKLASEALLPEWPIRRRVAAVSCGVVDGAVMVDLDYEEDRKASVDLNLVMTGDGEFVEIQASGEEAVFGADRLGEMISLGRAAILELIALQKSAISQEP